ncbi:2-oxoglutarate and iron-dependent oxygenase domain-containing protein [Pseudomonas lini]
MNQLPIIDISPLYSADQTAWQSIAMQIDHACREWGFFSISRATRLPRRVSMPC